MSTIKKEITVSSVALMSGAPCEARLVPSSEKGIRLHFANQTIEAKANNVVSTEHCTVLGNQNVQIMLVEHFMAACAICKIDSLDVYLTHFEMPILDGASKEWITAFREAGIEENTAIKKYTISEPQSYINGKTHIVMLPSDKLNITYSVNFNHPVLANKWVSVSNNFDEVIEARTFGYLKDLEMLQQAGYARGCTLENTLGLTENGFTSELKSELEPAKHKILDLIGDLYLTGINPLDMNTEIIVKEAGHAVHVNFAKQIAEKIIKEK